MAKCEYNYPHYYRTCEGISYPALSIGGTITTRQTSTPAALIRLFTIASVVTLVGAYLFVQLLALCWAWTPAVTICTTWVTSLCNNTDLWTQQLYVYTLVFRKLYCTTWIAIKHWLNVAAIVSIWICISSTL